jgi:hypothetical protein
MLSPECVQEFRTFWMPNMTDAGLDRLIDLMEKNSPMLIHGCFTKTVPMGCLATHVAWNHPTTAHLTGDAGINWLHRVAGLNPATSYVIREWDGRGLDNWQLRADFLAELKEHRQSRQQPVKPVDRIRELVTV